jgi:hypothetical protein
MTYGPDVVITGGGQSGNDFHVEIEVYNKGIFYIRDVEAKVYYNDVHEATKGLGNFNPGTMKEATINWSAEPTCVYCSPLRQAINEDSKMAVREGERQPWKGESPCLRSLLRSLEMQVESGFGYVSQILIIALGPFIISSISNRLVLAQP